MSFSKARIQRFNELENDVPAPGTYDPKFDSIVKGIVIEKSERFHDDKSVGSAECSLSICNKSTTNTIHSFRTPQQPRKKIQTPRTGLKTKRRSLIPINDQKLKYNSQNQLADLQVECSNKDRTIQEQEKHIEEMKEEVQKLQQQLEELCKKQAQMEEQHKKDMEAMAELQQEILNGRDEKYQGEVENLRCKLIESTEEKGREIKARKIIEGDLKNRIAELSERVAALETELLNKKCTEEKKIKAQENQIEELTIKLEKLTEEHRNEIGLLGQEKSELNSHINSLADERDKLELRLQNRQDAIIELEAQLSSLRYEHQEEIDRLKSTYEEEKTTILSKHESEVTLRMEIEAKAKHADEANNALKDELQNVQLLYEDVSSRLKEAHQKLEEFDKKYNLLVKKQREELDNVIKLHEEEKCMLNNELRCANQNYLKEMQKLTAAKDAEILELKENSARKVEEETKRVKQHAEKMIENAETVTRETLAACRAECEERVKKIIAENDAKVNAMIREVKSAVEEEMQLTTERYKACLARVEAERAALDEKVAQKDAEITRLSITLEQLKSSAETQESFGQSLQMELDRAETELAEKKEELRALKDQIRAEAAEMVARRKRFEIVMAENQASVAALTKRLAQSNAEVERLQHELKRGEDCINEHRDLLSIMRNNSQMVHEQVQVLMEQLDVKKGLVDQLETESINEVEAVKSMFEAKIEDLKQIATKEVAKLKTEYAGKAAENAEIKSQLYEMANHLNEARNMLLKLEETNDTQQIEISRLELLNSKINEKLKERDEIVKNHNEFVEDLLLKHEVALNEANSRIQELCDKIKSLEEKNNHLMNKTELFEEERCEWKTNEETILKELEEHKSRRELLEEENKKLVEYNECLMKNYQELNEKYAELVGHHNHRQRIKHLSQLKDKISQLEQELNKKMRIIEQQQKTIEKLKTEDKRAHIKGKENVLCISKTSIATPLSSPHKPLTPLRNRND